MNMEAGMCDSIGLDSDLALSKWAWPGGYPIYYIDGACDSLCPECAEKLRRHVNTQLKEDGFLLKEEVIIGQDVNWEDASLYCEDCGRRIESAYAEDEAE